ncbi:MAG: class I SAM-dependent methyltransferase [Bdellovibrionales bacterium]|nr:class I SAM-dependent methyltransferase [Bdellovibrionales bacterium]
MTYTDHWDEKFRNRSWGRYPPEDLVRFIGRNYKDHDRGSVRILEIGCGPGANIWFLHREGYSTAGIDISSAAIEIASNRLVTENRECSTGVADLRVGSFHELPWPDGHFDVVIDIFALYANPLKVISDTLNEVGRVLKPNGSFYSKLWGTRTTGFGTGVELEPHTFDGVTAGPCAGMGLSHFFDLQELSQVFVPRFSIVEVETVFRHSTAHNQDIEEFHCQFRKS